MNRVIKDIRLYESFVQNTSGNSLPTELGNLFVPTKDLNFIAQRIARKLNESKVSFGEYDHLYLNLTNYQQENDIIASKRKFDKRIQYIDVKVLPEEFNAYTDAEKNQFIQDKIFQVLKSINTKENLERIHRAETDLEKYGRNLKIHYKTKETKSYKIEVFYQIEPNANGSKAIVEYENKKTKIKVKNCVPLRYYEDIYYLINNIIVKGKTIIFQPKTSNKAQLFNNTYETPIIMNLT